MEIKIKKVLVVGAFSTRQYTYASSFYRVISEIGFDTYFFNYRECSIPNKKLNKIFMNYRLKKKIKTLQLDLIFFIKAETIYSKTIKWIKHEHPAIILINFYPDNPFVFWNGNSNQEVLCSFPFYDYVLSWSQMLIPVFESVGCKRVLYFPFVYDEKVFTHVQQKNAAKDYLCDVSFVGTWDFEREWWLTELIKRRPTLNLAIWGNNWENNLSSDSLLRSHIRGAAVYPPKSLSIFQNSHINLNFIRKQNCTSHNMRTFEIPASGGFMLAQRTREQSEIFFREDESIVCFDSLDELIKKIDFYLKEPSIRRAIIDKSILVVQQYMLHKHLKNLFKKIFWREDEHSREAKDCDTHHSQFI